MKKYRVGEICKITGLSRQNLADYARKEIVKPIDYEYQPRYKIYDENGLMKLKQIALLKGINVSERMIERIIKDESFQKEDVIKNQIKYLKSIRSDLDDKILVAKVIETFGIEEVLLHNQDPRIKKIVENIRQTQSHTTGNS